MTTLNKIPQIIPNPDPSEQTIILVDLVHDHLTEVIKTNIDTINTRLDAMDKASVILHEDLVRVPTLLDREIKAARELLESRINNYVDVMHEKFSRVDVLFVEGDKRTQQLSTANALALAAALQAAKEAVAEQNRSNTTAISKSEMAVGESIKQLQVTFQAANQATNEKIDDIKSRLDRGEGGRHGETSERSERRLDNGLWVSVGSAIIAIIAIVVASGKIFH